MKISKIKIRKLIKEAMRNINEKMSKDTIDFNFDDIIGNSGNLPPPEPPEDKRRGGGGGGNFIYLLTLCRKMLALGYNTGQFIPGVGSVDELLEFDESGLPESIHLEKILKTSDNVEVYLSFHAEFDTLNGTVFASCYDPNEGFTDIVDGFSHEINNNFAYISFIQLAKSAELEIKGKTSVEVIDLGNKLFSGLK